MIFNRTYYHALDRINQTDEGIEEPIVLTSGDKPLDINLGPEELGASLNPFQHQLEALNAKIKEGASKVEFEFFGAGKGQKERATPESFDKEFLRLWFKENCDPYNDPVLPDAPDDLVEELSYRYIDIYEILTGQTFEYNEDKGIQERIQENLNKYFA